MTWKLSGPTKMCDPVGGGNCEPVSTMPTPDISHLHILDKPVNAYEPFMKLMTPSAVLLKQG